MERKVCLRPCFGVDEREESRSKFGHVAMTPQEPMTEHLLKELFVVIIVLKEKRLKSREVHHREKFIESAEVTQQSPQSNQAGQKMSLLGQEGSGFNGVGGY